MFLEQEIRQQPEVISRLLTEQAENVRAIAEAIRAFDPTFVTIAARGTSDNAARYAQYLLGARVGLAVGLSAPSLHTLYEAPPKLGQALVIGISQSGRAEDVRQVLADANMQGAITLSITNYPDSPMAQTAQHHIELCAGEEVSIAATKTYTAQLTAIAMLAAAWVEDDAMQSDLATLPGWMKETVTHADSVKEWAERYRYMERFAVIGRGYNYATAFEISLKVKELAYIIGEGYSEADFRHGPIATVGLGFPVIAVAPNGRTHPKMHDLLTKLDEKAAETLVISNDTALLQLGTKAMAIPAVPEWISPVVAVVPGQVFAMQQALVRGYAVDKPRGLSKVTVTQ